MSDHPPPPDALLEGLPPLIGPSPRLLILGSMPGPQSLRLGQYYAHPQNAFWPIISSLVGVDTPDDYAERRALIECRPLILWDVLGRCRRKGALDAHIRDAQPNDLKGLIEAYPGLELVALNGGKAAADFRRLGLSIPSVRLPSTSPAYASLSRDQKIELWRAAVGEYFI
jgi:TDG/mug DNA glycosylase family protein